jgi:hypothetical protein
LNGRTSGKFSANKRAWRFNDLIKINFCVTCYLLLFIILRHKFHHNIKENNSILFKKLIHRPT